MDEQTDDDMGDREAVEIVVARSSDSLTLRTLTGARLLLNFAMRALLAVLRRLLAVLTVEEVDEDMDVVRFEGLPATGLGEVAPRVDVVVLDCFFLGVYL